MPFAEDGNAGTDGMLDRDYGRSARTIASFLILIAADNTRSPADL